MPKPSAKPVPDQTDPTPQAPSEASALEAEVEAVIDVESLIRRDPMLVEGKDPKKSYRLVRDMPKAVSDMKLQGWRICESSGRAGYNLDEVGTHRQTGDLVLMEMPRTLYEARQRAFQAHNDRMRASTIEQFHAEGDRQGVPTYQVSSDEARDRAQWAEKRGRK